MKKGILMLCVLAMFSAGCVLYESAVYVHRTPMEEQIASPTKSEKPATWYVAIAQAAAGIIPSALREVRLMVTDTAETVTGGIVDVKKNVEYEKLKYSRWFVSGPASAGSHILLQKDGGIIKQSAEREEGEK